MFDEMASRPDDGRWFWWDNTDGSLLVRSRRSDGRAYFRRLFALWPFWCFGCGRFSAGCSEHWFCGYCRVCEQRDAEARSND